jgi:hypothetical protein
VWREEVGRGSDCAREVLRPESSAWEISAAWRGAKVFGAMGAQVGIHEGDREALGAWGKKGW